MTANSPTLSYSDLARLSERIPQLKVVVAGDYCLDRYFDIDPAKSEMSIETGLTVHNIVGVRCLPGAAGTIVNNLAALGVGEIRIVGFCGEDGEGWELRQALSRVPHANLDGFISTAERCTFTYTKPLVNRSPNPPEELNRLDMKNWTPTPKSVRQRLQAALEKAVEGADALIVLEQTDLHDVGTVDPAWLHSDGPLARLAKHMVVLADSRRGLSGWPGIIFKMNAAELGTIMGCPVADDDMVLQAAATLAQRNSQPVFITMSERGIISSDAHGATHHVKSLPVRGPIDIVGAGDSVTANLATALAAGAGLPAAMSQAMAAASVVIHQLGTTGSANLAQIKGVL